MNSGFAGREQVGHGGGIGAGGSGPQGSWGVLSTEYRPQGVLAAGQGRDGFARRRGGAEGWRGGGTGFDRPRLSLTTRARFGVDLVTVTAAIRSSVCS